MYIRSTILFMNMTRSLLILILPIFLGSCASVYYPNHINSSFIEQKGEVNLGGAVSLSSINVQTSYAASDHIRLSANANYWGWSILINDSEVAGEGGLQTSFMAGYYNRLGDNVFFEGYSGIGFSALRSDFLSRAIVQPSIGFGKDAPALVFSCRANIISNALFSDPDKGVTVDPGSTNRVEGMFLDFGLTHRINFDQGTLFVQYGISRDTGGYGDTNFITFMNIGYDWRLFAKKHQTPSADGLLRF